MEKLLSAGILFPVLLALALVAGAPAAPQEIVGEIKDLEKTLGFRDTGNFAKSSNTINAYYRCYYTAPAR